MRIFVHTDVHAMPLGRLSLRSISSQIIAERTNQLCVDRVGIGTRLALKILILSFVKIAAVEQLQLLGRAVGGGQYIVLRGLVPHQSAIRLMGHHMNVLLVDVILAQFYRLVLVRGDARHDLICRHGESSAAKRGETQKHRIKVQRKTDILRPSHIGTKGRRYEEAKYYSRIRSAPARKLEQFLRSRARAHSPLYCPTTSRITRRKLPPMILWISASV